MKTAKDKIYDGFELVLVAINYCYYSLFVGQNPAYEKKL